MGKPLKAVLKHLLDILGPLWWSQHCADQKEQGNVLIAVKVKKCAHSTSEFSQCMQEFCLYLHFQYFLQFFKIFFFQSLEKIVKLKKKKPKCGVVHHILLNSTLNSKSNMKLSSTVKHLLFFTQIPNLHLPIQDMSYIFQSKICLLYKREFSI